MAGLHTSETGSIKGFVIFFAVIVALTGLWQYFSTKQQEVADQITHSAYVSPLGEVQALFPNDWVVGEESFEEEGYYSLELEGPRNESIASLVNEKYQVDINGKSITDSRLIEILKEPISADYILALIDIVSATQFELSPNREAWKEQLLANTNTATGTSFGKFEEITFPGGEGYRYTMTISEGENTIQTTNYFLLGQAAEVEASIFPNTSNNLQPAMDILESLVISELNSDSLEPAS